MFGAHLPELMLIVVGALVIFGPKRLPEIGSALGRGIRDFRHGVSGAHDEDGNPALPATAEAPRTQPDSV